MKTCLIGHTGFVGSNLASQYSFTDSYNSKNISDIAGKEYDLVVCAGVQAKKWWANQNPAEDWAGIEALLKHLDNVQAKRFAVISSVDVYPKTNGVDEEFDCYGETNHPYGTHRLCFEDEIRKRFDEVSLFRLSALFGKGLKKNIIYDMMHDNCLEMINPNSSFQWYDLSNLWTDVRTSMAKHIKLINLVNEPLESSAIADLFPGKKIGYKPSPEAHYNIKTIHSPTGYLKTKQEVLEDIRQFVCA
jgi:nucleoside-diphosphate-sugar epimerase